MSEPLKWAELTPEQRDELVAEKVMGWQPVQCPGAPDDVYCNEYNDYGCVKCGAYAPHGQALVHGVIPPEYSYSQSMDAAWKVVKAISHQEETYTSWPTREEAFMESLRSSGDENGEAIFRLKDFAALTPERICLAALKARGVLIEEKEKQDE